ncbi:MAG TPA: diacylglycerol kinase family protein, partial [Candidatus Limnocylindrales bacterium]|nr:diacylglycerol kinase family protein [Candidatus Limnocylindrales bacterium]
MSEPAATAPEATVADGSTAGRSSADATDPAGAAGAAEGARDASEAPVRSHARIRVIWNPSAGSKGGISTNGLTEEQVRELMARARLGSELVATTSAEDALAQAGDAVSRRYDLVVAVGGDGTVAGIAGKLLGSSTALGILPLGSVMNIARSLGIPRDVGAAADAIATGSEAVIDVGEVAGRPFYEAGSVGMNAAMFREAQRFDDGDWSSIVRTLWVALRYRPARMTIDLDDGQIRTRALMITVSNGPYSGAGMTVAPGARLDDGRFDVRVFRRFSKV